MQQSCQSNQGSPKGCNFPLLCAELGEKVWEKKSWPHWGTPLPCKSAGRQSRSGQGRDIPLAFSSPLSKNCLPTGQWADTALGGTVPTLSILPTAAQGEKEQEGWGCLQLPVLSWDCVSWSEKQPCIPRELSGFPGQKSCTATKAQVA